MTTISFHGPGMSCGHCAAAVRTGVGAVAGVESVAVDLTAKTVEVSGSDLVRAEIIAAIDDAGYDVAPR